MPQVFNNTSRQPKIYPSLLEVMRHFIEHPSNLPLVKPNCRGPEYEMCHYRRRGKGACVLTVAQKSETMQSRTFTPRRPYGPSPDISQSKLHKSDSLYVSAEIPNGDRQRARGSFPTHVRPSRTNGDRPFIYYFPNLYRKKKTGGEEKNGPEKL